MVFHKVQLRAQLGQTSHVIMFRLCWQASAIKNVPSGVSSIARSRTVQNARVRSPFPTRRYTISAERDSTSPCPPSTRALWSRHALGFWHCPLRALLGHFIVPTFTVVWSHCAGPEKRRSFCRRRRRRRSFRYRHSDIAGPCMVPKVWLCCCRDRVV